ILDDRRMVARLVPPRHTYLMHQKASENGDPLPIAVAIGVSPAVLLAASSRVPQNEEFRYASWLSGGELELWEAENGVPVPHAEYVIEGYIHPEERAPEGPFVDITGTYDRVRYEPVIYVERVWMREDPIYHALIPASGEHLVLMGTPYEPMIYSRVSENVEVLDVHLTPGGCSYLHCVVKIRKRTEGDAKNAGIAALSAHPSLKHVVIVDEDIDIYDPRDVEYAIATRVRGDKDIVLIPGSRGSSLDPMADEEGRTTKMIIDATKELKRAEEFERAKIPEV
ncbi:MAG: UbiD family decarboxylase, partial [Archaeoglobi archaeon]|nr:UbiD family decarboxylase [Candidatus Mnemosynella sp.]